MKKIKIVIHRYLRRNPFTYDLVPEMTWHITHNGIKTLCGKRIKIRNGIPKKEQIANWNGWEYEEHFNWDGGENCPECRERKKKLKYKLFGWLMI
jgi:hypothetical protein